MGIHSTFRKMVTVGLLAIGAAGFALADHGGGSNSGGKTGSGGPASSQIRLKTRLAGAAIDGITPEGEAEFRSNPSRGRSSLKVEAEHVNLPAGTVLTVALQHGTVSTAIGQITLNAFGSGELELDSQDGDTVPAVQKGDTVSISNGAVAILVGVF